MAGFEVKDQTFGTSSVTHPSVLCIDLSHLLSPIAVVTQVSQNLLTPPVSGLLGLGFASIASSGAVPFWQSLATEGALDEPLMAFQLTRFVDVPNARQLEPGGTFNSTLR